MLRNGSLDLISVIIAKTIFKRYDLCLRATFGRFCISTTTCSRNKMNDGEEDVWNILEEVVTEPATSNDVSDHLKKKERLKKAKLFIKKGKNQFSVTDLEDNLPLFQNQDIPLPPNPPPEWLFPPLPTTNPDIKCSAPLPPPPPQPSSFSCNSSSTYPQNWIASSNILLNTNNGPSTHLKSQSAQFWSGHRVLSKEQSRLHEVRSWTTQNAGMRVKTEGTKFRLLSYNVLAQDLLESNRGLYRDMDPVYLAWKKRWELMKKEIIHYQPHIVTLQEVQFRRPNYFKSHYLPFFEDLGYRATFKCRTGDKNDGCVIFYKRKIFKLDTDSKIEYFKSGDKLLDRDNIGLVARLIVRYDGSCVVVATSHLLFNKKRVDVRLAQLALLLAEVDKLREVNGQLHPVIITGDFNSNVRSPVYQLMMSGSVKYSGLQAGSRTICEPLLSSSVGVTHGSQFASVLKKRSAASGKLEPPQPGFLTHPLNLDSVYSDVESYHVRDPAVTTNHGDWTLVDYIFFSRPRQIICGQDEQTDHSDTSTEKLRGSQLHLVSRLQLPRSSDMQYIGRIPSAVCPSDHFPLVADFVLSN